jgi:hypothetical protein
MTRITTVYKEIDVDIDLEDIDDEDIIEEMRHRNLLEFSIEGNELLTTIYERRRMGVPYQSELDQLIYQKLGKIA